MTPIYLKNVDIKKVLVSNKISFGEKNYKYFIGQFYDNHKVTPSHIMLPKISTYEKRSNGQNKRIYFLIDDDVLLETFNAIWVYFIILKSALI